MIARALILGIAFLSLFLFPWQALLVSLLVAALVLPAAGVLLGVLADVIYYVPGTAPVPYMSLFGLAATGIALLVHRFVKTRIME